MKKKENYEDELKKAVKSSKNVSKSDTLKKEDNTNKKGKRISFKDYSSKAKKTKKSQTDLYDDEDIITRNYDLNLFEVVIIILITGVLVSIASGLIVYNNYDDISKNNIPTDEVIVSDDPIETFESNYNYIINNYVGEVDKDALIDAAIKAMYNEVGDTYTYYMDEEDSQDLMEQISGQYQGVGLEIMSGYDGEKYTSIVNRVFENSPAKEAGIQPGDILLELDGVSLSDKEPNYLPNIIKYGDKDTHSIKLLRGNDELTVTLTRKLVYINSVSGKVVDGVGYISIDTFSETTIDQVKKYIDEFDSSVKSVVFDVRDNSGGSLDVVYNLSDLFIEKGKNIYQYKDKNEKVSVYKAKNDVYRKFDKIAVLINGNSASASEIFALALKESAGATLVGTKSYGKGTVQETKKLTNGKTTKITIAYWLSPNGNSINEIGIEPDLLIENIDEQLNEAIKVVK